MKSEREREREREGRFKGSVLPRYSTCVYMFEKYRFFGMVSPRTHGMLLARAHRYIHTYNIRQHMEQTNDLSTEEVCLGVDHPPRRSPCIASCTLTPSDLTFSDRPLSGMYAHVTL